VQDVVLEAGRRQVANQRATIVAGVILVEVHGDQIEAHRGAAAERVEHGKQPIAVLAARHRDHDAIAVFDEVEVGDGAAHVAQEGSLGEIGAFLPRVPR
jgi:hypothetical protein